MSSAYRKSLLVFSLLTAALLAAAVILTLWGGEEKTAPASAPAAVPASASDWGLSFSA